MAVEDAAFEKAARAVHENYKGKGSWTKASPAERSKARQAVRLIQQHVGGVRSRKVGW